jgi:hypothetical protein
MYDINKKTEELRVDVNQLEDKLKELAGDLMGEPKDALSEAVVRLSQVRDLLYKCEDVF